MTLPDLRDSDRIALFLDFDGTLVAIADRPDDVRLDRSTRQALMHLDALLGGASAIRRPRATAWSWGSRAGIGGPGVGRALPALGKLRLPGG